MYYLGIVGAEAAKFMPPMEQRARAWIRSEIHIRKLAHGEVTVVSGKCHLGGIDIWAAEEARLLGCDVIEFEPVVLGWAAGYKPRNIKIAKQSDEVICIAVADYPPTWKLERFDRCYHCDSTDHVKSGGCWTMLYAARIHKKYKLVVIG